MKTITLIPTLLALAIQVMVQGQTQGNQVNPTIKADKINLHIVQQQKKVATHKTLPILGAEEKQVVITKNASCSLNVNTGEATLKTTQLSLDDLKLKAEELAQQAKILTNNALKLTTDNKIMQLEIAKQLQNEAYIFQKRSFEISFENTLVEFNFNKLEFYQLLKSIIQTDDIVTKSIDKHMEAERDLKLAKEMLQEAYAMPNLAAIIGTMSNAEEKEFGALKKQNQAIEQLKTIVLNVITVKENLVCLK